MPPIEGLSRDPLDVRGLVHNLEHGSVAVFVDRGALDDDALAEVDAWQRQLTAAGFVVEQARAGIFATVAPEGADVAAVSYRGWDVAVDCDGWDLTQADAFVSAVYGTRGGAPEGSFAPYPDDSTAIEGGPADLPAPAVSA